MVSPCPVTEVGSFPSPSMPSLLFALFNKPDGSQRSLCQSKVEGGGAQSHVVGGTPSEDRSSANGKIEEEGAGEIDVQDEDDMTARQMREDIWGVSERWRSGDCWLCSPRPRSPLGGNLCRCVR